MSYEGHAQDKDKILNALGGKRGLIDSGLPALIFLIVFNLADKQINPAIYSALTLSAILTLIRLIKMNKDVSLICKLNKKYMHL